MQLREHAQSQEPSPMTLNFGSHSIRTVAAGDTMWWVARDVYSPLGLSASSKPLRQLDDDEKGVRSVHTPGGTQRVSVINEFGLYRLIMRSRKAEAVAFQRWLAHEVLPKLKRDGFYSLVQPPKEAPVPRLQSIKAPLAERRRIYDRTIQGIKAARKRGVPESVCWEMEVDALEMLTAADWSAFREAGRLNQPRQLQLVSQPAFVEEPKPKPMKMPTLCEMRRVAREKRAAGVRKELAEARVQSYRPQVLDPTAPRPSAKEDGVTRWLKARTERLLPTTPHNRWWRANKAYMDYCAWSTRARNVKAAKYPHFIRLCERQGVRSSRLEGYRLSLRLR